LCAITLCGSATGLLAQSDPDTAPGREIAAIDSEYSRSATEKGMPAASINYFAEDGIAFAPFAVNGRKYWGSVKDFPGTLIWQPIFAAAARTADLAYTTGPWELKKNGEQISLGYGHYVTIWKRNPQGNWKMALDVGTENAQPADPPGSLQVLPPDPTAGERPLEEAKRSLQKTTRAFFQSAQQNIGKAILNNASDDIRIYREKSFPAVGLTAARLMLSSANGKVSREPGGGQLSNSADLSYSYGSFAEDRGNTIDRGIYVMIWRINMNGDWKLVLDLEKKVLPKEKS
jgi:ketosteroid isomerase-like protein